MTRLLIRVAEELSDDLTGKFPQLQRRRQQAQTTLTGDIQDQEELQGVLNFLSSMGVTVLEVITIPDPE
jgi:ABC-type protease/lipase transport system fused ATPase/permease subunit